jgi:hypothetical protein
VDAELHAASDLDDQPQEGVELHLYLNGALTSTERWPTRAQALEAAASKRADLERVGWTLHW